MKAGCWAILATGIGTLVAAAPPAMAQVEPFRACAGVLDDSARLACYDKAVAALGAADAAAIEARRVAAAEAAARAAAEAAAREEQARRQTFGAENVPAIRATQVDDRLPELRETITEVFSSGSGLVIELANGQVWRQSEAAVLPPIRAGDSVIIKRGVIGGYRMTFQKQRRTISVKRYR